ncbi:MAG: type III-B CRISPR module RAMP protein Cmr1 [Chlorobiaceae bacterium]|nr:type III-B CRISPR module RAMP protein Cmr1 [Chlorobiaceae bacterium]
MLEEIQKPKKLSINLEAISPVWTGGDVPGSVDRLHETGIIGSLRWWFEILVRGVGGTVKSPTDNPPELNLEQYSKMTDEEKRDPYKLKEAGLCEVSLIFGATNWKRRFRLEIQTPDNAGKSSDKGYLGNFTLHFTPLTDNLQIYNPDVIEGLVKFIADWGALGAKGKPILGSGLIRTEKPIDTKPMITYLENISGSAHDQHLPSLGNMFFVTVGPKNLRKFDRDELSILKDSLEESCNFIRGTTQKATCIRMCGPYQDTRGNNLIRLWGWLPEDSYDKLSRNEATDQICQCLKQNYIVKPEDWIAWDSIQSLGKIGFLKKMFVIKESGL